MKLIKAIVVTVLGLAIAVTIIYGCYWLAKTVSYAFFYEDMVQRTVVEMVKPEYLK
jgi:hypothetical protein